MFHKSSKVCNGKNPQLPGKDGDNDRFLIPDENGVGYGDRDRDLGMRIRNTKPNSILVSIAILILVSIDR